jgi:osmotically-inducible protein OsmY
MTTGDMQVRDAVLRQLEWDPEVDAGAVGVAAKAGTVTLTGYVDTYAAKLAAERAAKRVRGVRAVANDIVVRLKLSRTDTDVAADAAHALRLRSNVPASVQAVVHNGAITLTGRVDWLFQKRSAEDAVRHIKGVHQVFDHIEVAPKAVQRDVRHRIAEALHRAATLDARQIDVQVVGDKAILSGTVSNWTQRESAELAASDAPGITSVENRLTILVPLDDTDEIC